MAEQLKLLTYEEVVSGKFDKEKSIKTKQGKWSLYIKSAKKMKENLSEGNARMAIAELAERSCLIYWGGNQRTEEFKKYHQPKTLKMFAQRIGIPYATLGQWTVAKKRIFDHLTPELKKEFKISPAYYASLEISPIKRKNKPELTPEEVRNIYTEYRYGKDGKKRQLRESVDDFTKGVYRLFEKKLYYDLTEEKKDRVEDSIIKLYQFLNERKKIEKIRHDQKGVKTA